MRPRNGTIIIGILLAAMIASVVAAYVHSQRIRAASLVSLGGQHRWYPDGREVRIMIAGNANDRTAVVLVLHRGSVDPSRHVVESSRTFSMDSPIEGLISSAAVTTRFPPNPVASGIWVDGRKRAIDDNLTVIYMSDKVAATDISIRNNRERTTFLYDARSLDPLLFIEKWIKPRLATAQ